MEVLHAMSDQELDKYLEELNVERNKYREELEKKKSTTKVCCLRYKTLKAARLPSLSLLKQAFP